MPRKDTRASDKETGVKAPHRRHVNIKIEADARPEGPGTYNGGWGPVKT